jgi:hypothetical protein
MPSTIGQNVSPGNAPNAAPDVTPVVTSMLGDLTFQIAVLRAQLAHATTVIQGRDEEIEMLKGNSQK